MNKTLDRKRSSDFLNLLGQLESAHRQLLIVIRAKIEAMKKSDTEKMRELSDQEHEIVKRITEREGLRRQLMDTIGVQTGLSAHAGRAMSASTLTPRLPQGQKDSFLAVTNSLRQVVSEVARANRVAGAISRGILAHLKCIFASVAPRDGGRLGYSREGEVVATTGTRIFDAVG